MSMYVLKTIVAGDGGIGKTSLVRSFMNEALTKDYKMTIGVDVTSKTIFYEDRSITFSVHDLAGQQRFAEVKALFMKGTQLAVFVFDLTRRDTLISLQNNWIPPLMEFSPDVISILVGNKADLTDLRVFEPKEGQDMLKKLQKTYPQAQFIQYIETSATKNTNVNTAFVSLGKKFLAMHKK